MRKFLVLIFITVMAVYGLKAQERQTTDTASKVAPQDTLVSPFVKKVLEAGEKDKQKSLTTYNAGRIAIKQRAVWGALSQTAQDVKLYLDNDINIKTTKKELESIKASFYVAQDGILINKGTAQTERNLSVSSAIMFQLILETETKKKQIDKYTNDLIQYRDRIDSLLNDPVIYIFPVDSVPLAKYLSRLKVIISQANPSDNALNETLASAQNLQNETDYLLFTLKSTQEKIESYRNQLSNINLKREFANLWDTVGYTRPFNEIFKFSVAKERMALTFYIRENVFKVFLLFLLIGLCYLLLQSIRKKMIDELHPDTELNKKLIVKHPLAASAIIVLSIYQFAFFNAPFIFSFCIWFAEVFCLFLIFKGFITTFWLRFWGIMSTLFLIACANNFILQASRPERWIIFGLSLMGVLYGTYIAVNSHRHELKEKSIVIFIRFFIAIEALSFLLNLFGRYNLSKSLLITGYSGVTIAILFIWVVRLINEGLSLGAIIYKHPERRLFYLNFNRVGNKAPNMLYVLLIVGWLVIIARNFYAFKKISGAFHDFLHKERNLGDYDFSIDGLFLFLVIAFCSLALSRIVSFFAADPQATHGSTQNATKVARGSWILLLRIFIISVGLFFAFAASGLPLDKITIVLGALSVGIGLGLQGLVSNLVSGLIIAFERPVNVGDLIEINGKSGTMKSIGFRSSVLILTDGSSLVVPNGDLLNNHVINWSLSRSNRRLVIPIGVAYGSDLQEVKRILESVVNEDLRIVKYPAALAAAKSFSESAIGFELIFWIKNPTDSTIILGDVIIAIHLAFNQAGITIPFPQHEVYLKAEKESTPKEDNP
jgi:potassium efflux system protein